MMTSNRVAIRASLILSMAVCFLSGGLLSNSQKLPTAGVKAAPRTTSDELRRLLPTGTMKADVMLVEPSARLAVLGAKMNAAMKRHPQWVMKALQQVKPGQPLPYHPNLGLSRSEYKELLSLFPHGMIFKKVADATLTVKADGASLNIEIDPNAQEWTGLEINLDTLTITTPFGLLKQHEAIDNTKDSRANNRWRGTEWTLEKVDGASQNPAGLSGTTVHFAIGQLQQPHKGRLYYRVQKVEHGQPVTNLELILNYDLPVAE